MEISAQDVSELARPLADVLEGVLRRHLPTKYTAEDDFRQQARAGCLAEAIVVGLLGRPELIGPDAPVYSPEEYAAVAGAVAELAERAQPLRLGCPEEAAAV